MSPLEKGPVTKGQRELRDNEDAEGPGPEIIGHAENEHWDPPRLKRGTESQSWMKGQKLLLFPQAGLSCGSCGRVLNFQTDSIDEWSEEMGKRSSGSLISRGL